MTGIFWGSPDEVLHLWNEQEVFVSKRENEVKLECESGEEADALFEWLAGLRDSLDELGED